MKVRLLQNITINGREFPKGQVLDIHHKHVDKYLKSELVELFNEPIKVKEDAHQIQETVQDTEEYSEDW
jgi:hypothetical protein